MAYADDAVIAKDVAFMAWIAGLEKVVQAWGDKHCDGEPPYGLPLVDGTGLSCWHDCYADGMTPQQAFDEDQSNWEE